MKSHYSGSYQYFLLLGTENYNIGPAPELLMARTQSEQPQPEFLEPKSLVSKALQEQALSSQSFEHCASESAGPGITSFSSPTRDLFPGIFKRPQSTDWSRLSYTCLSIHRAEG